MGVGCRINPFEPIECGYGAPEGATLQLQCFYWHGDPLRPNGNTVWWRVTFGSKDVFIADTRARLTPNVALGGHRCARLERRQRPLPACESDAHTWYNGTGRLWPITDRRQLKLRLRTRRRLRLDSNKSGGFLARGDIAQTAAD